MSTQYWSTLISAPTLHEHLHDTNLVIVDCRFELGNSEAGYLAHKSAHLPGAVYAHLDRDLSGPISAGTGRHPLPDVKTLSATLGSWGIDRSKQVVTYDADTGAMAAARLWWLLRWLGHERVAVLDGGLKHWQASGLELTSSSFMPVARVFAPAISPEMLVDAADVALRVTQNDWRVLDVRAPERYAGETEPIDAIAGHIPGAVNHPFVSNLAADGRFLPSEVLRSQFNKAAGNVTPRHLIGMCGSGVTACHTVLALEHAGLHGAKLYAGSWSEWIKDPRRPVATGPQP
jgi:thiosulfate/3-mercaptopyruvate sulfurtransferase